MTKREKNLLSEYCEKLFLINKYDECSDSGLYEVSMVRKCCIESTAEILGYSLNSSFITRDNIRIIYLINYYKGSKLLLSESIDIANVVCFGLDYELESLDFNKTINELMEAI